MGHATGIWNREKTEYDELWFGDHTKINRLENFEAWALLNQELYGEKMVMAPDGILYCTEACAIIDNPEMGWTREDLEIVSTPEFWMLYAGEGINPSCKDECPHCGLEYPRRDVDYWKGGKKKYRKAHKARMIQYINNRTGTGED